MSGAAIPTFGWHHGRFGPPDPPSAPHPPLMGRVQQQQIRSEQDRSPALHLPRLEHGYSREHSAKQNGGYEHGHEIRHNQAHDGKTDPGQGERSGIE